MTQTTITARISTDDKNNFDKFCSDVGITPSAAINMFVKTVLRKNKIPFEIERDEDPFYSKENIAFLKEGIEALNAGKGVEHDLIEV